jgi:predicted transcriptional regulator
MWLVGAVAAAAILVGTVVALGGRVEAATWGLVVAAGAMVFALRSLYRMATALARPPVEAVLDELDVAAYAGLRELREERRRLLRAINELQFDYEMGKLSEEDYRKVRQGYELQAVEVIRALDAEAELHPDLVAELRRRGLVSGEPAQLVEAKPAKSELEELRPVPVEEAKA